MKFKGKLSIEIIYEDVRIFVGNQLIFSSCSTGLPLDLLNGKEIKLVIKEKEQKEDEHSN